MKNLLKKISNYISNLGKSKEKKELDEWVNESNELAKLHGRYSNKKDNKSIKATIIFPDPIPVKKINDNKDAGATKFSWDSGMFSEPDPKLSNSEYLDKLLKGWDELDGHSESTKKTEQPGTFTSQISGYSRKRGKRS